MLIASTVNERLGRLFLPTPPPPKLLRTTNVYVTKKEVRLPAVILLYILKFIQLVYHNIVSSSLCFVWYNNRVSSGEVFNKRFSIDRAPRINSAPFFASTVTDANIAGLRSASPSEWVVMVSLFFFLHFHRKSKGSRERVKDVHPSWKKASIYSVKNLHTHNTQIGGQTDDDTLLLQYGSLTSLESKKKKTSRLWNELVENTHVNSKVFRVVVVVKEYRWRLRLLHPLATHLCLLWIYPWAQWTRFSLVDQLTSNPAHVCLPSVCQILFFSFALFIFIRWTGLKWSWNRTLFGFLVDNVSRV